MLDRDVLLLKASGVLASRPTATMDELAAAIGVGRATLFRAFGSRERLVSDLCRHAVEAYTAAVDRAQPEEGDAVDALRRVAREVAALAPDHGLLALQPLPEDLEEELSAGGRAVDARVERLVVRGQEAGELRADVPAEWVLAALTWLVVAAADGLRRGSIAPLAMERLVSESVVSIARRRNDP